MGFLGTIKDNGAEYMSIQKPRTVRIQKPRDQRWGEKSVAQSADAPLGPQNAMAVGNFRLGTPAEVAAADASPYRTFGDGQPGHDGTSTPLPRWRD